ncbi:MAG: acetylxylan esterase [Pirellulales bacterium]|nr:acetylxylan esterase [Pirellulales bacterium]
MNRLLALAMLLTPLSLHAAEFPPPERLPRVPELPNPLVTFDGTPITTAAQWQTQRKPELKRLFEHYMYGRQPAAPPQTFGRVLFEDAHALGGQGVLREMELTFGPPEWPKIYLLIAAPKGQGPFPCFVGANFGGNHLFTDHRKVRLPQSWVPDRYPGVVDHRATDAGRGAQAGVWPLEGIVARGYATATFYCGDVQPDRPDVLEGMRAVWGTSSSKDGDQTATIMTWAWGIQRAIDYLATDHAIDAKRIAVVGHSRLGKTALVAAAFDDRIALAVANQAGCGGSGPSRHHDPKAETVERITRAFPHWFCQNFTAFGPDPARLPFDQHALVALCAPRPVLFTAAADDLWANPAGKFEVLKAATPVYELLGVEGLKAEAMPAPDAPLIGSRLGYWIRRGQHAMSPPDWQTYLDFADKWLK